MKLLSVFLFLNIFYCSNSKKSDQGDVYYYKLNENQFEIIKLTSVYKFEYYKFLLNFIDAPTQYSQGNWKLNEDSSIVFKNKFTDSINLNVIEKKIEKTDFLLYKFIEVVCNDPQGKMRFLAGINYDMPNDDKESDNLVLCVFGETGSDKYKPYNFDKKSFGKVYYETEPSGFYLKVGDEVVSNTYFIKNKKANHFEISIDIDARKYIYSYKTNFLNKATFSLKGGVLTNSNTSEIFKRYSEKLETNNIEMAAKKIFNVVHN